LDRIEKKGEPAQRKKARTRAVSLENKGSSHEGPMIGKRLMTQIPCVKGENLIKKKAHAAPS